MNKLILYTGFLLLVALSVTGGRYFGDAHLSLIDIRDFTAEPAPIGRLAGSPLERLSLQASDLKDPDAGSAIRFRGKTPYLNNAQAVVTHTVDDSSALVPDCLDALDQYGVKATVFISTEREPIAKLWNRLRQAVRDGHEIGSHSRRHQCQWPDTPLFCFRAYTDYEVSGSRDDILAFTDQPYVWSWAYPCGNCERFEFVRRKLARAGYLTARTYPGEEQDLHNVPDLQTYAAESYRAAYTQVVQKKGGIAKTGRTDVTEINRKFDQVYQRGGIYHFLTHPQWLDYGPGQFYERHLNYIAGRKDIWYVPMGPLYAYRTLTETTSVRMLQEPANTLARFVAYNELDPQVFSGSITLEFEAPEWVEILAGDQPLPELNGGLTDRWDAQYYRRADQSVFITVRPNTILSFR